MGLSESKKPFADDGDSTITNTHEVEIGFTQHHMVDPRSPSCDFERTPDHFNKERTKAREEDVVITDPRSPSQKIQRTPMKTADEIEEQTATEEELRVRIQRLKLLDTPVLNSTDNPENLLSNKEVINPTNTVLKLLDDEVSRSLSENFDSVAGTPISPPTPQCRSTPNKETERLLKKKRRRQKAHQTPEKLQKTVVKKAFTERIPRSPLTARNGDRNDVKTKDKNIKTTGVVKYSKYKVLNESLTGEIFPGKENEEFVW